MSTRLVMGDRLRVLKKYSISSALWIRLTGRVSHLQGAKIGFCLPRLLLVSRHHTAKTEMVGSRADLALAARPDHVARAVLVGAEKRAAAMNFLLLGRLRGIEGANPAPADCALRLLRPPVAGSSRDDTSRWSTARRCRPCRYRPYPFGGYCATASNSDVVRPHRYLSPGT